MFRTINGKIAVTTTCPMCGDTAVLNVSAAGYAAWQNGTIIQTALPELDVDDRERLISGICPICWDKMFSVPEDDDDDYDDCDYEMGFDPYMGCYSDDC